MSEKDQAGHGIEVDPEKVDAHLTGGAMKKLKASEITEAGLYWGYFEGQLNDEAPLIISRKGGKDLYIRCFGSSVTYKFNANLTEDYWFIKADPPKVCRWEERLGPNSGERWYETDCGHSYVLRVSDDLEFVGCPYCVNHIEVKEEQGNE